MRSAPRRSLYVVEPRGRIRPVRGAGIARRRCRTAAARERYGAAGFSALIRLQGRAALRRRSAPHTHTAELHVMFTGIVVATGRVTSLTEKGGDLELGVDAAALDLER